MSDVLWIHNPSILIKEKYIHELYPQSFMSKSRKINSITRLIILVSAILFFTSQKLSILLSGLVALGLVYIISTNKKEGMKMKKMTSESFAHNPLSNALAGDGKEKKEAPDAFGEKGTNSINQSVKEMIQEQNSTLENINDKLFKDLGESFEFDRSMRQFYSTASTTIPNDQKSFADFCYGDMVSGKEGDPSALTKRSIHLHQSHL